MILVLSKSIRVDITCYIHDPQTNLTKYFLVMKCSNDWIRNLFKEPKAPANVLIQILIISDSQMKRTFKEH